MTASGSPPTDTVSSAWAAFARFHAHQIERGKKRPARSNKLSRESPTSQGGVGGSKKVGVARGNNGETVEAGAKVQCNVKTRIVAKRNMAGTLSNSGFG